MNLGRAPALFAASLTAMRNLGRTLGYVLVHLAAVDRQTKEITLAHVLVIFATRLEAIVSRFLNVFVYIFVFSIGGQGVFFCSADLSSLLLQCGLVAMTHPSCVRPGFNPRVQHWVDRRATTPPLQLTEGLS